MQVFEPHSLHVNRALFLLLNAVMVLSHTQTSLPCTQRSVMVKWRLLKQNVEALKKKKKKDWSSCIISVPCVPCVVLQRLLVFQSYGSCY